MSADGSVTFIRINDLKRNRKAKCPIINFRNWVAVLKAAAEEELITKVVWTIFHHSILTANYGTPQCNLSLSSFPFPLQFFSPFDWRRRKLTVWYDKPSQWKWGEKEWGWACRNAGRQKSSLGLQRRGERDVDGPTETGVVEVGLYRACWQTARVDKMPETTEVRLKTSTKA